MIEESGFPFSRSVKFVILLGCLFIALSSFKAIMRVLAQSGCTQGNTPSSAGQQSAWAQNTLVAVNIDSNTITQAQFDNCIKPVFDNFNLANGATQGNASGVFFSVTFSPNSVASVNSSG